MTTNNISKPVSAETDSTVNDMSDPQLALQKSEQRLQLALDGAGLGMWDWNVKTGEIYLSPRYLSMLGYGPTEIPHTIEAWANLLHPEERESVQREMIAALVNGSGLVRIELRMRAKAGHYLWILGLGKVVERDADGLALRASGTHLDITENKEMQRKLLQSENKFRSMMESMQDLVCICSQTFQVEYMNPAFIKRFGRNATGEFCYKALFDFHDPCSWCHIKQEHFTKHSVSEIVSPKDNRSYSVSYTPINNKDGSLSTMTIYRDITQLKNLEAQLYQAQKMEAIGTLAGGIAHDFNNILTAILGFSEMARLDIEDGSQAAEMVDQVISSGRRAAELVQQILSFSRKEPQKNRPLQPHLIICEALKMLHSSLPATIKIEESIDKNCGKINADPIHLHQIVMNLCTNALQSMVEEKGTLRVKLQSRHIKEQNIVGKAQKYFGNFLRLTISDTGCGIDKAALGRIFEPYFTTKDEGKGTGLGLAVVHRIVESLNGFIEVESAVGKGTDFHVYLPLLAENSEFPVDNKSSTVDFAGGTEHILMVDDEGDILDLQKSILLRLGYEVTAESESPKALAAFTENPDKFDLIITDQSMPDLSGIELALEVFKIRPEMPIILCTGYSSVVSEADALAIGVKKYIEKPVSIRGLAQIVRSVLDET